MSKLLLFSILVFITFTTVAQQKRVDLKGTVTSTTEEVVGVYVLNRTTEKGTITNLNGYFSIPVRVKDTLEFSAVQFTNKVVVVTETMLKTNNYIVPLYESVTTLNEVVVKPFNLSGDLSTDLNNLPLKPVVTGRTLGLPNQNVKILSSDERALYSSMSGGPILSLINAINGQTKLLKKRVERNHRYQKTMRVKRYYADSLFVNELKIEKDKIDLFMWYCEFKDDFQAVINTKDQLKIWAYLRKMSVEFRSKK
ncbi:carboxypeptidase-like protein [Cellulophaga sp. RHA_52]|uniref:carboxypeptidase-like regulatory domain-containing protein n=1 Tax=Cellulophaga sp. RHA_52 TaxID=1250036 RepID=UPI001199377F|nr:carboxypeptidase-like regulatory domain-containing protein [Cellulophaga sp. RHA_52]TVZ08996.1 carboxypeptidase-like protein [Cellulophaga sp. RHA_52]